MRRADSSSQSLRLIWRPPTKRRNSALRRSSGAGRPLGAAILAQNYVYESKSVRFFAINAGCVTIGLAAMGTIIGVFQAS